MKKVLYTFSWIGLAITWLVFVGLAIYTRWSNIDMTETRLFLTYWKEYLVGMVIFLAFGILYKKTGEK